MNERILQEHLNAIFPPERIRCRLIDRIAYSCDAGFYKLIPQAVVLPINESEIGQLLALAGQLKLPVTFRTGGTSLSGQSVTNGILVDLSQHWRNASAEDNGCKVRVQPGIIGSRVNLLLKKYGTKMGPDPSSIASAMMGGILANNASGMCCGVKHNSYHTLQNIRFVLTSGNAFSTELTNDYLRFEHEEKTLFLKLGELRDRIKQSHSLSEKIRLKYRIKNTVGYSLNAFLDYEHPLDIFAHLLIGSEGTLAFISEATLHTLPDLPFKATALLLFHDITAACEAIQPIKDSNAEAVELMDRASLKAIEHLEGMPAGLSVLPITAAALLIEYQSKTALGLEEMLNRAKPYLALCPTLAPIEFSRDLKHQAILWKIRKGLFPAVGAVRAQGTTVILEDVAFPLEHLAEAVKDLQTLFLKFEYNNAIIFGHAKDGNLHFVVTQSFNDSLQVQRYAAFMESVVELVIKKYNGSLKAEHGTGRNMSPFVETEWGPEAYAIMKELKVAADPAGILNPDVIISNNAAIHLQHLKDLPAVESEVDKCIECGFCERLCPSRDITLTPRKRIIVRRHMRALELASPDFAVAKSDLRILLKEYEYDGNATCAVDGMCATDCPVEINTGLLIKRFRSEAHSATSEKMAVFIYRNLAVLEKITKYVIRAGNAVNKVLGANTLKKITSGIRRMGVPVPMWMNSLIGARASKVKMSLAETTKVVVFESCIQRMMGGTPKELTWMDTLKSLCFKADIELVNSILNNGKCCGQAFSSKGYSTTATLAAQEAIAWLWNETNQGAYPVVVDTSSCSFTLSQSASLLDTISRERLLKLEILDVTAFSEHYLLPRLTIKKRKQKVALHPVCTLEKMKLKESLLKVAGACADEVVVPPSAGCCGMAGDRGFLYPELIAAATKEEASELKAHSCDGYYSTGRTCEMALSETTGKEYVSLLYLLDEVS